MAIEFDGNNQYISVPSLAIIELANGFTWSAWCRTTAYDEFWMWVFSSSLRSSAHYAWFQIGKKDSIGDVRFETGSFTSNTCLDTTGENIADGNWHHLVGVWDRSGEKKYIYLDGEEKASAIATVDDPVDEYGYLLIGAQLEIEPGPRQFWQGDIDECCIWDVALDADEIATLAKSKRRLALSVRGDHVVGYWRLDGPNGTVAAGANSVLDLSGNGNHGTPYNDPVYRGSILTYPE